MAVSEAKTEGTGGVLHVTNGAHTAALTLVGAYDAGLFLTVADTDGSLMLLYGCQANNKSRVLNTIAQPADPAI